MSDDSYHYVEDFTGNLKALYPHPDGSYSEFMPSFMEQRIMEDRDSAIKEDDYV